MSTITGQSLSRLCGKRWTEVIGNSLQANLELTFKASSSAWLTEKTICLLNLWSLDFVCFGRFAPICLHLVRLTSTPFLWNFPLQLFRLREPKPGAIVQTKILSKIPFYLSQPKTYSCFLYPVKNVSAVKWSRESFPLVLFVLNLVPWLTYYYTVLVSSF